MLRAIACEGVTDQIILGHLLIAHSGWKFEKQDRPVQLPGESRKQFWYRKDADDWLVIWGLGGRPAVYSGLEAIAYRNLKEIDPARRFTRLATVVDSDLNTADELWSEWRKRAGGVGFKLSETRSTEWIRLQYQIDVEPPERADIDLLHVVLPPTGQGCLEVFLCDSLAEEDGRHARLVASAREFTQSDDLRTFLERPRLRHKACLGSVLSVLFPDWAFTDRDARLRLGPV